MILFANEELDGPAVSALRRKIAEVKQRLQLVGHWMSGQNLLPGIPPCFRRHVRPLILAVFAVVNTHHCTRVMGYGPFSLCEIHKEGLCHSSGDINRLVMMILLTVSSMGTVQNVLVVVG
jgi:hypothetical protein